MTAKQMHALGWRNATTSDAAKLVLGRRYLVANRKGTKVRPHTATRRSRTCLSGTRQTQTATRF